MFRKVAIAIVAVVLIAFGALWAAVTYFLDSATIAEQLKKEVATRFPTLEGQIKEKASTGEQ